MNRRIKGLLCFAALGVTASATLVLITGSYDNGGPWYVSTEQWIAPTFVHFALASLLAGLAVVGGCVAGKRLRLIDLKCTCSLNRLALGILLAAAGNGFAFWIGIQASLYPVTLLLPWLLHASSTSGALWVISGIWSNLTAMLLLASFLVIPSGTSFLRIAHPVELTYPVVIPFIIVFCGYWLSLRSEV